MANLLASPRFWKKKALIIKGETGYGVDAIPTGAANYIEARNVSLTSFDAETADRNIDLPYLGNGGKIISSIWSKLSFEIALTAAGALGTAPKYGPVLLGVGFAETISAGVSVTYNLISEAFGSLTAYLNIDGVLYKFVGSRGEASVTMSAKGIPMLKVELTSGYSAPVDAAPPALTKTGWLVEEAVNSVNTTYLSINAVNLPFSTLDFALGNQIGRLDLPGPQREVLISDRSPTASATVLAPLLAAFNPYTLAAANTPVVISTTHGTVAGKKVKVDVKAKISGIAEDQVEGLLAYKLTFTPEAVSGNDEITITCL